MVKQGAKRKRTNRGRKNPYRRLLDDIVQMQLTRYYLKLLLPCTDKKDGSARKSAKKSTKSKRGMARTQVKRTMRGMARKSTKSIKKSMRGSCRCGGARRTAMKTKKLKKGGACRWY